jgi:hypothetical protein
MAKATGADGRQSGTGQDTPLGCVHVPPRFPLRRAGHGVTLSRPVPLSRIACPWKATRRRPGFSGLTPQVPAALCSCLVF